MGNYRIAVIPTNFKQVQASDLEIDSGTLSVDATNNRVGVGTSSPGVQLEVQDTTTSSANTGGSLRLSANDGAAMGDSHRLGVIEFTGAEDTSNTQVVGARIEAMTDAAWTNAENGTALYFYTTDGNASQTNVLKIDSNQKSTLNGVLDITDTTDSSNDSGDTGALRCEGGASIAKKLFVGTDLTVTGDLTVNGTTTTINSTTLTVDDKVVVIASGAADSSAADGAGISVDGASATILYDHTGTQWEMNKPLEVTGAISSTSTVTATGFIIGSTAVNASAAEINEACDSSGRTAAAVAVADDHFLFCDGGATGATRVESLADYATAIAGTGISASSGVLNVDAAQTQITSVGTIGTGVWQGTAIAQAYIAGDAINGSKIADDSIDSEHYVDGSIDTAHLAADAVTGAKIADDAINSEHYTDGSIDTAHIADDQVTLAKMAGLARGSLIIGNASGNPTALSVGSDNHVLTVDSNGDIGWEAASGGGSIDINGLSAAAVDVAADSIAIVDANDSNASKKESIADLATAMAGTGITASSGVFSVTTGPGGPTPAASSAENIIAFQVFS